MAVLKKIMTNFWKVLQDNAVSLPPKVQHARLAGMEILSAAQAGSWEYLPELREGILSFLTQKFLEISQCFVKTSSTKMSSVLLFLSFFLKRKWNSIKCVKYTRNEFSVSHIFEKL